MHVTRCGGGVGRRLKHHRDHSLSGTRSTASAAADDTTTETADAAVGEQATSTGDPNAAGGEATAALEALVVKGRAPKTDYDREQCGPRWADTDHNGCDTRNDILARDLGQDTFEPGTNDCVVLTGA